MGRSLTADTTPITKKSFARLRVLGQTDAMSAHTLNGTMNGDALARPPRLRRILAGLMTVVIVATSFTLALREPALAKAAQNQTIQIMSAGYDVAAAMTPLRQERPTPCQKSVLPGAVNTTCPLSNFSFNSIPVTAADITMTAAVTTARWQLSHSTLPPQCSGFSPYRPPCFSA